MLADYNDIWEITNKVLSSNSSKTLNYVRNFIPAIFGLSLLEFFLDLPMTAVWKIYKLLHLRMYWAMYSCRYSLLLLSNVANINNAILTFLSR